jgi:hypothetical protein
LPDMDFLRRWIARHWLKADYPAVAENYAEMRRGIAKKLGLGRKPGAKVVAKFLLEPGSGKKTRASRHTKAAASSRESQVQS